MSRVCIVEKKLFTAVLVLSVIIAVLTHKNLDERINLSLTSGSRLFQVNVYLLITEYLMKKNLCIC